MKTLDRIVKDYVIMFKGLPNAVLWISIWERRRPLGLSPIFLLNFLPKILIFWTTFLRL